MSGVSIDHIIALIIFISAIFLFMGLFTQTVQTGIVYQQQQSVAAQCSELLDTMLLSPGSPSSWGQSNTIPTSFGIQDPEFTQYQLSAFSLLRLESSSGNTVEYDKTSPSIYYNEIAQGPGAFVVTPNSQALNYSEALTMLGLNGTDGFQLQLTPDITVSVTQTGS